MAALAANLEVYRGKLQKGCTETLVLSLLANESMYGYQLVREIDQRSNGYFRLKEGTLYPALHRLEREGLLDGRWEESPSRQSRRYYHITPAGLDRLESMLQEWGLFSRSVNLIAQPISTLARGAVKNRRNM